MRDNQFTRRRVLEWGAGLSVVGVAGCLSGGSPAGTGSPTDSEDHPGHAEQEHGHDVVSEPKASREVVVNTARKEDTTEYHFEPHVTWVTVGGTVTWTLESGSHTATAYHPDNDEPRLVPEGTAAWDSGLLTESGETYQHTFDTEGVYHYLCNPHEEFGMLATVIVGRPHLDEQVALGKLPEDKSETVHGKLEQLNEMVRSILDGGHHDETDTGHHDDGGHDETETGHHDETDTDHHDGTETETGHHDG